MDSAIAEWDLVIKVKHGDTLKRFGAHIHGQAMNIDMGSLRTKITHVFNFHPDTDFSLSYIDGDGDIVMLDDDDELRDASINQHLNPLRINVNLKSHGLGSSDKGSYPARSTPSSPGCGIQQSQLGSAIIDALKSLPVPLHGVVLQISQDFLSKATSSSSAFSELMDYFNKMGLHNLNQSSSHPINVDSTPVPSAATSSDCATAKASSDHIQPSHLASANPSSRNMHAKGEISNSYHALGDEVPEAVSLDGISVKNSHASDYKAMNKSVGKAPMPAASQISDRNIQGSEVPISRVRSFDVAGGFADTHDILKGSKSRMTVSHVPVNSTDTIKGAVSFPSTYGCQTLGHGNGASEIIKKSGLMSGVQDIVEGNAYEGVNGSIAFEPFISSSPEVAASAPNALPFGLLPVESSHRRADGSHENMLVPSHRGVQCDGCGMYPIVGPRFKSIVKEDYDLCKKCFSYTGNEAGYTRIDSASYRLPRFFKERYHRHHRGGRSFSHAGNHGFGMSSCQAKLGSRFVQDVTVLDGTTLPPATPFTKIWRMRNSGTVSWPFGTQLVWIGGDSMGNQGYVPLQIPTNGCAVNEEIDIAVDFTAPARPGRCISYWKMASPSGQTFGQRIWVLIQVECLRPSVAVEHSSINLNFPQENVSRDNVVVQDVNAQHQGDGFVISTHTTEQVVKPPTDAQNRSLKSLTATGMPSNAAKAPTLPWSSASVPPISYPVVDQPSSNASLGSAVPEPRSALGTPLSYPLIDFFRTLHQTTAGGSGADSSAAANEGPGVEQSLLVELEAMGFKQVDLNKEVLRMNDYNLEQSVDDLCGYTEWEPLLEELWEMGFNNKEINKKVLIKNGGSIKRAVLDLIASEDK